MPAIIVTIASFFGISAARLIAYVAIIAAIIVGGLTIRQHYINKGYNAALVAVKKQDNIAIDAAKKVEKKTAICTDQNGYWDVVTQSCRLGDE